MNPRTWDELLDLMEDRGFGAVEVRKGVLPHPKTYGLRPTLGMPDGRVGDYWTGFDDGSSLHVRDHGRFYEVVFSPPRPHLVQAAQDAPAATIGGGAAVGAAVGAAFGRTANAVLAGAAVGGLLAALLVAAAPEED